MSKEPLNPRLGTVGGQAVIEGVMMKGRTRYAVACRQENGNIRIVSKAYTSLRKKHKIFNIPILRGIVNFFEMMALSYKTLEVSADAMGLTDIEPENKFEEWMDKHLGKKLVGILMTVSTVLGTALGVVLFTMFPTWITKLLDAAAGGKLGLVKNLVEGLIKIGIFLLYLWGVGHIPDIHRTFEYHGAEHKSIFCYEAGDELTVENVKKYKRFHPRCGTSFLFVMLILSILIFSLPFVTWDNVLLRVLTKLALLPVIIGVGFEFIMYAGKHDNLFTKILSAPGLWTQRITTQEPDGSQIECAIAALKSALPDVFPGFEHDFNAAQSAAAASAASAAPAASATPAASTAPTAPASPAAPTAAGTDTNL